MYGLMRAVVAKCQLLRKSCSSTPVTAPLLMTFQCDGAVTVTEKAAFRSGWSKQAYIRLASAVSNWE